MNRDEGAYFHCRKLWCSSDVTTYFCKDATYKPLSEREVEWYAAFLKKWDSTIDIFINPKNLFKEIRYYIVM